jgi:hypothetical protein
MALLKINAKCLGYAGLWFISNAAFGLAALIFLSIINPYLKEKPASHEIEEHISGGIVLFVCCALMGAVIVDILIEKLRLKNSFAFFAVNIAPFVLLGVICLIYLLIILGQLPVHIFSSISKVTFL